MNMTEPFTMSQVAGLAMLALASSIGLVYLGAEVVLHHI
jgi:hypothetical protein